MMTRRRLMSPRAGILTMAIPLLLLFLPSTSATAQDTDSTRVRRVVFVCEHGSVKSLIAASYFNRTAKERGLPFDAIARGTTPERTVPLIVQKGLGEAGMNVSKYMPQMFMASDLSGASVVVSFDQDIEATADGKVRHLEWDDLPGVLADYPRGRDAIVQRVNTLIDALAVRPELEAKIPLGEVHGRIDHLAFDSSRHRLFVAELGNDTVGVVDLKERKSVQTLTGLKEPQGIGYLPSSDTIYVANGGDGTVRLFRGSDLAPAGQIPLGDDADNVRVDPANHRVIVGYGSGSLAVIDAAKQQKIADIRLKAHPESFQLDSAGQHTYVNVPDARQIAVVDLSTSSQSATWSTNDLRANYPLALDESRERVLAVFRHPARLGIFRAQDGTLISSVPTCSDADDVFLDLKRSAIYVICGEGYIDVIDQQGDEYKSIARIPTAPGARTGLLIPAIDRLLIAVRATQGAPAEIWMFNLSHTHTPRLAAQLP